MASGGAAGAAHDAAVEAAAFGSAQAGGHGLFSDAAALPHAQVLTSPVVY